MKGPETPIWLRVAVVEASILGATLPVWVVGIEKVAVRESGAEVERYCGLDQYEVEMTRVYRADLQQQSRWMCNLPCRPSLESRRMVEGREKAMSIRG